MVSIYKELSYDQEGIETVRGIQFSVLGPNEINARSVVEVTKPDTYSGNEPVIGGLFDPRMGILEHNRVCSTCELKNTFCPGHFGHIKLARPVYHPLFFNTVRNVLKCVCFRCSRMMVSARSNKAEFAEEVRKISAIKNSKKRLDAMLKLCGNTKLKRCGDDQEDNDENTGCKARQPSRYIKEQSMRIVADWKDAENSTQKEFTAEDVLRIFQRLNDDDITLLGFNVKWNRPEYMILTNLAVPPPCVRPSIIEENGQRREDDLTHKLSDILKFNNQLRTRIETGKGNEEQLKVLTNLVQYHIATFMDNQIPGLPVAQQRNGRKLKSITDRLKKKEGRIRGNLNGKRVDQSARSVITPDPNNMLDQLGVPIRIAMTLTFPEVVNKYNIEHMRELVHSGPDSWPGAKYVRVVADGVTVTLKYADRAKIANDLKYGDVVDRHIMDGDTVLFNRQPSLHKMSMMAFRVKVMPFQTFRLNVLCTNPFNADFDGDEMNKFMPQCPQTMTELKDLAAVPYLILAPRDGKPIVEIVQDTMLGIFRITKDWTSMDAKILANLQMVNSYFNGYLPEPEKHFAYSGKQALSQIMPPGLFIDIKNKAKEKFKIVDGQVVSGAVDKTVLHSITNGILPVLYHDYGPHEVRRFLDNVQRLICRWLITAGFSVGISDLVTDTETSEKLKQTISKYKDDAYSKMQEARIGKLENKSIFSNNDYFEREMLNVLNELTSQVGKIGLKQIDERTNRMINMVKSGSKGKETNVAQMIACVGQQNVDGKRVSYGFTDRTLPHYTKYDDGPEARGFVENSFISGLSPQEVFFHAMGGREGLIDTAVRTSETGYIQRRLVKAMEDCKVYYDQTVRNAAGSIVQFLYGEDGIDGIKIENQYIPYLDMTTLEMDAVYNLRQDDKFAVHLTKDAVKAMKDTDWVKKAKEHFDTLIDDKHFLIDKVFKGEKVDKIQYTIPFDRIIKTAMQRLAVKGVTGVQTDLTPGHVLDTIDKLVSQMHTGKRNQGVRFLGILLRLKLSPKKLLFDYHMPKDIFDWVVSEIKRYFVESIVQAGEMVGIVSAQSIGEQATQQTLDSFHSSGTAAAVKATSGVPRLKELLSVSKNIKTPSLIIYLKNDIGTVVNASMTDDGEVNDSRTQATKEKSILVMKQLEIARMVDILEKSEVYWDPPSATGLETAIEDDSGMMQVYKAFAGIEKLRCRSTFPWVLRLKFNKEKMHNMGLTALDIYMKMLSSYANNIDCVFSDDNTSEVIFRVRLTKEALKDIDPDDGISALKAMEHNIVHNILLKGVKGIKKVSMRMKTRQQHDADADKFHSVAEWVLDTDGTNLQQMLANPNVDQVRTRSNDIYEIYQTLGVEAARNALYQEFTEVVGEGSLNYRHMSLLLDTMTSKGTLMSIDRHGINRGDVGPLAKSSFEETTDMLINASIFGEHDNINGVSANIMLGQLPPCGTGDHEVILDEKEFMRLLRNTATETTKGYVMESPSDMNLPDKQACSVDTFSVKYTLPKKQKVFMPTPTVTFV